MLLYVFVVLLVFSFGMNDEANNFFIIHMTLMRISLSVLLVAMSYRMNLYYADFRINCNTDNNSQTTISFYFTLLFTIKNLFPLLNYYVKLNQLNYY
jgi:hypothetical protein